MIRDKLVFGGLVGFLSKFALDIFEIPMWMMKVIKHPLDHYGASLFLDQKTIHHTVLGLVISVLTDYVYGVFLGSLFVYLVKFTGKRNLVYKGLIFGAFLWLFSFGGLRSLPMVKLREVIPENVPYYLFLHLVFGLALGLSVKVLFKRHWVE
ncbi:MAG TPA: hypothetical protein VHY08_29165 [Bacillota bacterium]|nr:hypothetical protein [Bacillota bacterium]